MDEDARHTGRVGEATLHVLEAPEMWQTALKMLQKDAVCLVDAIEPGSESHVLRPSSTKGSYAYRVQKA